MQHCHACEKKLDPECPYDDNTYQFDNALWITFDGGYGMFIDPMFDDPPRVVICHECAHQLCDLVPWVKELLNPHGSHAHRIAWKAKNPDHYGWDYDPKSS